MPESSSPQRGPQHDRLDVFVGRWALSGHQQASPFGPAAEVAASESYEWLPGRFFLVHRFEGRVGAQPMACIEIAGYDDGAGCYRFHAFYNDGRTMQWNGREDGDTWVLEGAWPDDSGRPLKVRCTMWFIDDGHTRTARWEHSTDGVSWQTFWDVSATRPA
ncbi:DUF1579 family protein [Piscinibacter sp. XHJ-5]|uniref:DUF1579 family protein n=1 Tax=Piscinibacter sp. XHJ-5 TaxID=3037797 RepID=UPI0024534AB1|nr:DUF1579 family protein [Piscinibacter sp. XHJ-5]